MSEENQTTGIGNALVKRCPFCEQPNLCGVSSQPNQCWCTSAEIRFPAELLALLPVEKRGQRCVCRNCAKAFQTDPEGFKAARGVRRE